VCVELQPLRKKDKYVNKALYLAVKYSNTIVLNKLFLQVEIRQFPESFKVILYTRAVMKGTF